MTENNIPYLFERAKSKGIVNPLNKYAANKFSQDGEDGIIERIFEAELKIREMYIHVLCRQAE